jgi:hypothetical protein
LLGAGFASGAEDPPPCADVGGEAGEVEEDPERVLAAGATAGAVAAVAFAPGSGANGLREAPAALRCADPLVVSATGCPVAVGACVTGMLGAETALDSGDTGEPTGVGVAVEPPPSRA